MSVAITARHYFLGLSDELAVKAREQGETADENGVDIAAEARVKLYPRRALSSPQAASPDEIFFCRRSLVWSAVHRERLRFDAAGPISDAELCSLCEEAPGQVLCISEPGLLSMYSPAGDLHEHTLKQPVRALWSTPAGLLIEGFDGVAAQLATHLITGPQQLRTLDCTHARAAADGAAYAWQDERVLHAHECTPVVVTSDPDTLTAIRIWCLKAYPEQDVPPAATQGRGSMTPLQFRSPTLAGALSTPPMPPSAMSSKSRVRTPDGHTQAHVFTAYRSDINTGSSWGQTQARACDSICVDRRRTLQR